MEVAVAPGAARLSRPAIAAVQVTGKRRRVPVLDCPAALCGDLLQA
jgi:hypothetical protein